MLRVLNTHAASMSLKDGACLFVCLFVCLLESGNEDFSWEVQTAAMSTSDSIVSISVYGRRREIS